jgi:hypothetical protein
MKQIITLLLSLIFALSVIGQENSNPDSVNINDLKNEIGINMASITQLTHYIAQNIYYGVSYKIFTGVMYKRHFGKNALRVGFDFYHYNFDYDSATNINNYAKSTYYKVEGLYNIGKVRVGYERALTLRREQPFFATDLSISYGKGKNTSTGYFYSPSFEEKDMNIFEIGIEPAIGVKYQLIRRLSLTLEISASLYYVWTGGDVVKHSDVMFALNPVRLFSCNFHF